MTTIDMHADDRHDLRLVRSRAPKAVTANKLSKMAWIRQRMMRYQLPIRIDRARRVDRDGLALPADRSM